MSIISDCFKGWGKLLDVYYEPQSNPNTIVLTGDIVIRDHQAHGISDAAYEKISDSRHWPRKYQRAWDNAIAKDRPDLLGDISDKVVSHFT